MTVITRPRPAANGSTGAAAAIDAEPVTTVDLTKILLTGEVLLAATAVITRAIRRPAEPSAPRADIHMGPGGWVSMRGGATVIRSPRRSDRRSDRRTDRVARASASSGRRPWWAVLLGARPAVAGRPSGSRCGHRGRPGRREGSR